MLLLLQILEFVVQIEGKNQVNKPWKTKIETISEFRETVKHLNSVKIANIQK